MSLVRDLLFLSVHLQFEFENKIAHHTEEDKEAEQDQDVDPIDLEDLSLCAVLKKQLSSLTL